VFGSKLNCSAVARREELRLAIVAASPHGTYGMDDALGSEATGAGQLRISRLAPAVPAALVEDLRARCAMDSTVDTTTTEQAGVGRVDDRIGAFVARDVAKVKRDDPGHGRQITPMAA